MRTIDGRTGLQGRNDGSKLSGHLPDVRRVR